MQWSLNTLPSVYSMYATLKPSCDRLTDLLKHGEHWCAANLASKTDAFTHGAAVELSDAAIGYRSAEGVVTEVLNVAKLRIEAGEFVLVCGRFGSGKSSLLSVLAGAASLLEGRVHSARSRAFVPQKCFLFNGNLKENILFGLPFHEQRYNDVLRRTALYEDLECFPQKDLSMVGENGVQLSGGQKTRVGLARALYSDAEVYFLDDVMSAVDSHTGKHIWEHVLVWLHKQGRTVILVTHQLQYLSHFEVDRVLLLKYSAIFLNGAWDDIMGQVRCSHSSSIGR